MPGGYALSRDVGCGFPDNPWAYFGFGPEPMFMFPQSIATSGKVANLPPAATTVEGQSFFADQARLGGWTVMADQLYRTLFSTTFPGQFLPQQFNSGMHITANSDYGQYNMGQIYLNNAFTWTFIRFSENDLSLVPFNRMDPGSYPVPQFVNNLASPIGLNNENVLVDNPDKSAKWGPMIRLALREAQSSRDGFGCCGKALEFICQSLDNSRPEWKTQNKPLAKWWKRIKPVAMAQRDTRIQNTGKISWTWGSPI